MYLRILFILILSYGRSSDCQLFSNSILSQFKKSTLLLREDDYQGNLPIYKDYDYVIVGASPSGCALANRLSEDPDVSVLLLEAGYEANVYNDIPVLHLFHFVTEYNWKFKSQYNPGVCRSMKDETCPWPSGKGIGGGTVINALLYTRGNKNDYDQWADDGNEGWSYKDLLKYFNKLETTNIPDLKDSPMRGKDGPLWVSHSPYRNNASLVFIEAGQELGYPIIDYNLPYESGFAKMQVSLKDGYRSSASNAYLKPVIKRPNLHIVQRAFVTKVLIDENTMTALGVQFIKKGEKKEVRANREVILAAGAFGSPKLLMLSGIGPKDHLENLNIKVIKDLPVGNNLQEHVGVTLLTFIANPSTSFVPDYTSIFATLPVRILNYDRTRDGPVSSSGVDSIAYVSSRYATDENPDVELLFVGATYASDFGLLLRESVGVRDDIYESYYKELERKTTFSIWVMGCYPKSRGTFRLASRDPYEKPIINNNFFNQTEDVNVIVDGIKKAIELTETRAMKQYGVRIYKKHQPGCEDLLFGSDEYWECAARQITAQYHHQCGTCKMGPDGDPTSVVDPRLRVRGVRRLRVADASIIPIIPAGHTQAPAFMIGEKAADMIKDDYFRR